MFWKKFKEARSADKLFNQASECWRQRQRFLLEGNQKCADESCVEVVRLCQLAIGADERMGDAYILLANALMSMADQVSEQAEPSRHDYILSRAMAIIHLWHSLPYRSYPISKNAKIGEQLWITAVQGLMRNKSLSESAALASLDSYRDILAAETTSPKSFETIKEIILTTVSTLEIKQPWLQETLEETLSPETSHFLIKILPEVIERKSDKEQIPADRLERLFRPLLDDLNYTGKITNANFEILERIEQALDNNNFREIIGWMGWLFLLLELTEMVALDSDSKEKFMADQGKFFAGMLNTAVHKARQAEDWQALVLTIGLCEVVGVPEKRDEVLRFLYNRIGENGVENQAQDIKRRPLMLIEDAMVNRILRYLGNAK